jgi:rod shape-determining protein MreC
MGQTFGIVDMIGNLNTIYNENNSLKEKNVSLLQENANLEYLREENEELKKLLDYVAKNPTQNYVTAAVYAQDPLNLTNLLTIDKGTTEDIKVGQHVVYNGIYLGQVISTNRYTSQVKLITDPTLSIIAQIPSINSNGILHGQIGFGMILEDIPPDASLEIGQLVTTSPIDANMPDNLILGEIIEIIRTDQNIFQKAIIKPYYQPIDLKYVLVYINDQN